MRIIDKLLGRKQEPNKPEAPCVYYLPWVGAQYKQSACRIMGLGESHYCAHPEDSTPLLTRSVIDDFLDPDSEFEPYKNTYTKFTRALAGYEVPAEERRDIWDYIMFYNYVQSPISGPRESPSSEEFRVAEKAFRQVVAEYKPDVIVVWGKRLFGHLPKGYDRSILVDGIVVTIREYDFGGHRCRAIRMTHPSAAYVWRFWHDVIEKTMKM